MALATQCPHCFTTFRVAADQLKLRGGIVRCGACQSIFDGNAHLIDLDKLAADKAAGEVAQDETPAALSVEVASEVGAEVGTEVRADLAPEVIPDLIPAATAGIPPAVVPEAAPLPAPALVWRGAAPYGPGERIEPSFGPPLTNDLIAEPESGFDREEVRLPELVLTHGPAIAPAPPSLDRIDAPPADITPALADAATPPAAPEKMAAASVADTADETDHADADVPADIGADADAEPHAHAELNAGAATAANAEAESQAAVEAEVRTGIDAEPKLDPELEPDTSTTPVVAPADTLPATATASTAASAASAATLSAALPLRASAGSDVPLSPPVLGAKTARSKALDARTRRSKLTPTKIETAKLRVPPPDPDEPEFVKRSRRQERGTRTRRIAMGAGAAVLALGVAAQVVTEYRNVLAARYPAARPVLSAACTLFGCHVTLPAQVDNLAIDTGELTTLGPNTFALTTQLRNEGGLVQAWPSIELELIDADDKPVLRRVFGPADYLPPGASAAAGFGPRAEQPVKLHFALADLKPAGYHTFVFYP